jgi:hypothetical protein
MRTGSRRGSARFLRRCARVIVALGALAGLAGAASEHDGSHDFDLEIGDWSTHIERLRHPLSGSHEWVEYRGTSRVKALLGGRANTVELEVKGAAGSIDGISLRLYEPDARQWTLNYANIVDGRLTTPMIGEFRDGRGLFYGQDSFNGRAILVRFIASAVSADLAFRTGVFRRRRPELGDELDRDRYAAAPLSANRKPISRRPRAQVRHAN